MWRTGCVNSIPASPPARHIPGTLAHQKAHVPTLLQIHHGTLGRSQLAPCRRPLSAGFRVWPHWRYRGVLTLRYASCAMNQSYYALRLQARGIVSRVTTPKAQPQQRPNDVPRSITTQKWEQGNGRRPSSATPKMSVLLSQWGKGIRRCIPKQSTK